MRKKRILITGAGGMLGKEIMEVFRKDDKYEVFAVFRKSVAQKKGVHYIRLDLRKLCELKRELKRIKPDIIIHCAALVDVDYCEKHKNEADRLHYRVTDILSSCNPLKIKFVYISTDSVFAGRRGNYRESDDVRPLNYYAESKLRGERIAMAKNKNSLIIRTNIYGFHVPLGNSLAEWALANLLKNKKINGFSDVFFNPVYTKQLSRIIKILVENSREIKGVLNVGSERKISKYIFLTNLARAFKKNTRIVSPISMKAVSFKAKRPRDTSLAVGKLRRLIKKVPSLAEGLKELRQDYEKYKNRQ